MYKSNPVVMPHVYWDVLVLPVVPYLHLGCYKETGYPDELQHVLLNVVLRQHEAVEVILSQVERLPVQSVGLTHLGRQRQKEEG